MFFCLSVVWLCSGFRSVSFSPPPTGMPLLEQTQIL
jgi:hypothetical protein